MLSLPFNLPSHQQVHNADSGEYQNATRQYCMDVKPETVVDALRGYLDNSNTIRYDVIPAFLSQIEAVRKTLLESSTWRCVCR